MNISVELYRVFYTVAKHRSFSRAAEELYVSQSAVSQSVKNLENTLGFPLFIRTTKQVDLTIDGDILYTHLEQAFRLIKSAEEKLKIRQDAAHGQLVFASTDTLCKYFLLPKIKQITLRYPNIKIKIINGTSVECIELLLKAKVDFALINLPNNLDEVKFNVKKRYPFRDVFIASDQYEVADTLSLKEIAQHPLLVLDHKSVTRGFLDELFYKNNLTITPEIELQNLDILIEMAEIGLGISFVPDLCLKNKKVKIITTKEQVPAREYGIISLNSLPLTPAAETFLGAV